MSFGSIFTPPIRGGKGNERGSFVPFITKKMFPGAGLGGRLAWHTFQIDCKCQEGWATSASAPSSGFYTLFMLVSTQIDCQMWRHKLSTPPTPGCATQQSAHTHLEEHVAFVSTNPLQILFISVHPPWTNRREHAVWKAGVIYAVVP